MTSKALRLTVRFYGLAAMAALAAGCSSSSSSKCDKVTCPAATDLCHVAGSCDSSTGACSAETAKTCPSGQSCDVADGQCKAANACAGVTCPAASDLCHVAGTCSGGHCSAETAKTCPSGQSCDVADGQCKATDRCAGVSCPTGQSCDPDDGECKAVELCAGVTCSASDLCHVAGTCSQGTCSPETAKTCENGKACDPADGECKSGSQLTPKPLAAKGLAIPSLNGLALDSGGATYVAGQIFPPAKPLPEAIDFDEIKVTPSPPQGQSDVLLAKYDPGTHKAVWAKAYGDSANQATAIASLALTRDGTLAVVGSFDGTLGTETNKQTYPIDFLMGVDSATGDVKWTKMFDDGISGVVVAVAANPSRNVIAVCGYSSKASDMVTPAPTYGGGTRDAVIAAFDSNGQKLWAHEFGGANVEMCSAVAVNANGDVYAVGRYNGVLDLGLGALPSPGGSTIVNWLWVAKFNGATGATMAATHFEGHNLTTHANMGNYSPQGIAVDAAGDVAVVGSFTVNMMFGSTTLVTAGGADAFIAKLDSTLAPVWAVRLGGSGADIANDVAFTWAGDAIVVGSHVGASTGAAALTAPGTVSNAFVLKLSAATGETQFAATYGDEQAQSATRVAVRGSTFSFGGASAGVLDFGGGVTATNTTSQGFLVLGALQ